MKIKKRLWKALAFLLPLGAGVAVFLAIVSGREEPERRSAEPAPQVVRTIEARAGRFVPRASGFGLVQATRTWRGIAEVAGRVIERHPALEDGQLIPKGSVLVRVDPASYELSVRDLKAQLAQLTASEAELQTRESNTQATLEIEERSLAFHKREVDRQKQLLDTEAGSESAYEQEQRSYLQQLQRVQELRNTLALIGPEKLSLAADRDAKESRLAIAELDLEHTVVRAPFDCRVRNVNVEREQFVRAGDSLCDAYDVASVDLTAQLPMSKLRDLLGERRGEVVAFDELASPDFLEGLGITAIVRLPSGGEATPAWTGRLSRIGSELDPQTRTMQVVVRVDDPYGSARLGIRPPLVPQMYCQVELRGPERSGILVVPRSAVHEGRVYVAEDERLQIRDVRVGMVIGDYVVVEEGLEDGDQLVVSDVVPAVPGLRLRPEPDAGLMQAVGEAAAGTGGSR